MKINLGCYTCNLAVFPALALTGLLTLLISLGFWQLDRAEGKRQLQELNEDRAKDQVLTLSIRTSENIDGLRYRKVELNGSYDDTRTYLGLMGTYIEHDVNITIEKNVSIMIII